MKKKLIFLSLVFILAFTLRFLGQPRFPSCLHRDEAQFAYNAYSILQTGRDEWGEFLPLHFKFNGEYHVPAVFYLTSLAIFFLGPLDMSVRVPAIILGSLIPILGYLLTKLWFKNEKLSLALALLLTINPWQIVHARASGQISIIALFFGLLGFYWLFRFLANKLISNFVLAIFSFMVAYFSYIASRLDIPILLAAFLLFFHKKLPLKKITFPIILLTILLPFMLVFFYPKRFVATSVFAKHFFPEDPKRQEYVLNFYNTNKISFFTTQSRAVFFESLDNYFDYLNPYYIFRNLGEPDRNNINEIGSLYLIEIISLLIGLYALASLKNRQLKFFLIAWLVLTPIVGAVTYNEPDRPDTARTVYLYFGLSLVSAYGLVFLLDNFKKKIRPFALSAIIVAFLANGVFFARQLVIYSEPKLSAVRSCGYKELFTLTEKIKKDYDTVLVGTVYDYPYIEYLWYTLYPPEKYHEFIRKQPDNIPVFIHTEDKSDWRLEEYVYTHDSCPTVQEDKTLIVGNFDNCKDKKWIKIFKDQLSDRLLFQLPDEEMIFKYIASIPRVDGRSAFDLYTYEPDLVIKPADEVKTKFMEID